MAKKTVASLKSGSTKNFVKVIKMVKSEKSNDYAFREDVVNAEHVKDFFAKK